MSEISSDTIPPPLPASAPRKYTRRRICRNIRQGWGNSLNKYQNLFRQNTFLLY